MVKFYVKNYGSNITIFVYVDDYIDNNKYVFYEYHDNCICFPYEINFGSIVVQISEKIGRKLNIDEVKSLKE